MKRAGLVEKELIMKAKVSGLLVLVMHMVALTGFSLVQGCKTAKVGGVSPDQPVVLPADDIAGGSTLPVIPSAVTASGPKVYSVQKGDTLSSIASSHGTSWKHLAEYNNLSNPNQLKTGQELRIPESMTATVASASKKHTAQVSSRPVAGSIKQGSSYVIQKGDMLSSIAKRSGLTVTEIKVANSLTSDSLVVGKSLTIPKKGAVKAAAVAKPIPAKAANPAPAKVAGVTKDATVAPAMPAPAPLADATPVAAPAAGAAPAVKAPAVPSAAAPVAAAASAPVYEHVLYPGETLDDVARQYGSSQQEIMKINNITDAASIKPGTKLLVPIPE
jgi:LysM repeat protein